VSVDEINRAAENGIDNADFVNLNYNFIL